MLVTFESNNKKFKANLDRPLDISIPLHEGELNPNCYYAEPVQFNTIVSGDFIGSVAAGGSVNYQAIRITPHGNGTHTECYGHISSEKEYTLNKCLKTFHFTAQLMTLPVRQLSNGDEMVLFDDFITQYVEGHEALIIRTSPNEESKMTKRYSGTNPCYVDHKIVDHIKSRGVKHILIDLPSLDKEVDGGKLLAHNSFWNMNGAIRKECTITELIYVSNDIKDGIYLLNLQITSLETDASPSKPVLFKIEEY